MAELSKNISVTFSSPFNHVPFVSRLTKLQSSPPLPLSKDFTATLRHPEVGINPSATFLRFSTARKLTSVGLHHYSVRLISSSARHVVVEKRRTSLSTEGSPREARLAYIRLQTLSTCSTRRRIGLARYGFILLYCRVIDSPSNQRDSFF